MRSVVLDLETTATSRWYALRDVRPTDGWRLVCFPFAGGGGSVYRGWSGALAGLGGAVVPALLPGREGRFREPALDRMDELAGKLADALDPLLGCHLVLFGHSFGGAVAIAVAHELQRTRIAPAHVVLSCTAPPAATARAGRRSAEALLAERRRAGLDPDLLEAMRPTLEADLRCAASSQRTNRLSCPITAVGARDDVIVPSSWTGRWSAMTEATFETAVVAGGHLYLVDDPRPVLDIIAALLRPLAARRRGGPR